MSPFHPALFQSVKSSLSLFFSLSSPCDKPALPRCDLASSASAAMSSSFQSNSHLKPSMASKKKTSISHLSTDRQQFFRKISSLEVLQISSLQLSSSFENTKRVTPLFSMRKSCCSLHILLLFLHLFFFFLLFSPPQSSSLLSSSESFRNGDFFILPARAEFIKEESFLPSSHPLSSSSSPFNLDDSIGQEDEEEEGSPSSFLRYLRGFSRDLSSVLSPLDSRRISLPSEKAAHPNFPPASSSFSFSPAPSSSPPPPVFVSRRREKDPLFFPSRTPSPLVDRKIAIPPPASSPPVFSFSFQQAAPPSEQEEGEASSSSPNDPEESSSNEAEENASSAPEEDENTASQDASAPPQSPPANDNKEKEEEKDSDESPPSSSSPQDVASPGQETGEAGSFSSESEEGDALVLKGDISITPSTTHTSTSPREGSAEIRRHVSTEEHTLSQDSSSLGEKKQNGSKKEETKASVTLVKEKPPPPTATEIEPSAPPVSEVLQGKPCTKVSIEEKLQEIASPFMLSSQHFAVDFKLGVRVKGRDFDEERATKTAYLPRAVSETPSYEPVGGVVLLADVDEPGIGSDIRLIHLTVRPSVCEEKGSEKCTIPYLLPPIPLADPAHRILALSFDSPTGKKFKFTEVLKLIQQKPRDVDLRRISLSRLIEENSAFFNTKEGKATSPSWNVFKVFNPGQGDVSSSSQESLEKGENGDQDKKKEDDSFYSVDTPILHMPGGSTKKEKLNAAEAAESQNADVDGVSTPQFGGYSPGSGGQLKASTIFGYILGSLLIIAVFVGIIVVSSDCVSKKSQSTP
ncbi:transmembrane protein [Cystoisospora suis]|uniref:Transmembrane protein n=1 Tax=Cystoisospora suis TaxID=483139 RepID=A0A2C6LB76_9APIC|nr:transmembrane protein [Cystoisospora suis]